MPSSPTPIFCGIWFRKEWGDFFVPRRRRREFAVQKLCHAAKHRARWWKAFDEQGEGDAASTAVIPRRRMKKAPFARGEQGLESLGGPPAAKAQETYGRRSKKLSPTLLGTINSHVPPFNVAVVAVHSAQEARGVAISAVWKTRKVLVFGQEILQCVASC